MRLEPCDIFFSRSKSILGWLIRKTTQERGEAKTWANHTGIVVKAGDLRQAVVVEALTRVFRRTFYPAYGKGPDWEVYRPLTLEAWEQCRIVERAETYVGRTYGYLKILAHAGDWLLGNARVFRRLCKIDRYPICSYLVAHCFQVVDKTFGVPSDMATPDDMMDFCQQYPNKYALVARKTNGSIRFYEIAGDRYIHP